VSVGGHYTAGEDVEGGLREIHEELGLVATLDELVQLGRRREEVVYENGLIDREVQDVYLLWRAVELADLRPDPDEVVAVAVAPARELLALADGRVGQITVRAGRVRADRFLDPTELAIRVDDLVPASGKYLARIARFATRRPERIRLKDRRRWL
jgi:8-oxo-dGTP pyrophosphatase MutT (NUDIX family)